MVVKPNLLGNDFDAVARKDGETAGVPMASGRTEPINMVTPRAVAAVPETRQAEQAALLRPKVTATSWRGAPR
jgi:hypothetical protein